MNWLAHIFVSADSIDYQLGNLLSDPLKGRPWPGASEFTRHGFAMHRLIDRFTDKHPAFINSKSRLGDSGFLRGVVIDMVYDHLLLRSWDRYASIERTDFIDRFNSRALATSAEYPSQPRQIVRRIVETGYLTSYADLDGLDLALQRIDARLSRKGRNNKPAAAYMPEVKAELAGLQRDFDDFFPGLLRLFKATSGIDQHPWMK